MHYRESLRKIADHASQLYLGQSDDRLYFHNLTHVGRVLDSVNRIHAHCPLDERDYFILCTAVWFYDLEIIVAGQANREIGNTQLTEEFLQTLGIKEEEIAEIKKCLLVFRNNRPPDSLIEKVMLDAQQFYFGLKTFEDYHKLLRWEIEAFASGKLKGSEWTSRTISLLENHHYHTAYTQELLNSGKQDNLRRWVRRREEKYPEKHPHGNLDKPAPRRSGISPDENHVVDPLENRIAAGEASGPKPKHRVKYHLRGVETMFRNSSSNHQRLSVMADNKAFIMISVNSILISVGIGLIIGKFVLIPKLFVPTVILLSVNVVTIIYSVLATRPGVMKGTFTRQEVEDKTVDLLFFGSFYKMPLEDFEYGMRQMMDDSEFLYGTLIKDIYQQGRILGRKFRLLRISYNLFMYGTALTVLAYIASFFL